MPKKTKAVVAGGAGFIGFHLCKHLLERGYEVICIDNLITGNKENIKEFWSNPRFKFIRHDIIKQYNSLTMKQPALPVRDTSEVFAGFSSKVEELAALASGFDNLKYIYHLASPASPKKYQKYPLETLLANSLGTFNLLVLAKKHSAKFLYASSSEVYGDPEEHPQKETYWGNVNPVGPRSCYDEAKRFGEALTMAFVRKEKVNARIVRIFNTYGPKMAENDGRAISNFISQAIRGEPIIVYGNGTQTRAFCYVSDMVEGLIKAMESDKTQSQVFNLGSPDEQKIIKVAKLVKKITESPSRIVFSSLPKDDPSRRKPDIAKAIKFFGWRPKVALEKGLKKTIKYFRAIIK